MADVTVTQMASLERNGDIGLTRLIVGIGWAGAVAICLFTRPAAAYRPFDGTDAAVADVNETEIELQPFGWQRTGSQSAAVAPFVVYNYGFADRWEMVLQTENADADHRRR
jgi:hypothetical protein